MSAARKLSPPEEILDGPLLRLYRGYLEETGSKVAAAILADAHHRADALVKIHTPGVEKVPEPPSTLNPPQIAKQLRVSHDTVLDWIRRGELKASNLAAGARPRYVVTPEELAAFLKGREPEPPRARGRRRRSAGQSSFRMFSE